jgi:subtilase family serine protease
MKPTNAPKQPVKAPVLACMMLVFLSVLTLHAQSTRRGLNAPSPAADVLSRVTKVKGLQLVSSSSSQPPSDLSCRIVYGDPCYSPQEIQKAYGLTSILNAGYTGAGQTIIIIDSFGSPTIEQDLKTFDAGYGLPDPPSFKVLAPLGTVPFDPTNSDQVGWASEATLDVEWAHVTAPGASIVLLTSPVSETEGVQGMPEFLALEKYALDHNLGKIISQSWGATENTLFTPAGQQVFNDFEQLYAQAEQRHVTVLASAGDTGSANYELDGVTLYSFPTVEFPASSPLVTAVGGTSLYADTKGNYEYEIVWNDFGYAAGGGGVSQQFSEPLYQLATLPKSVQALLGNHRGIPDVAYNADPYYGILIYLSFLGPDAAGYYEIGGTSEGSPQWAGIIADANQLAGHPLGFLNPKLYSMGQSRFFHDIVFGANGFYPVPGYVATRGWDLTTGWGTPDVGSLVWQLAQSQ